MYNTVCSLELSFSVLASYRGLCCVSQPVKHHLERKGSCSMSSCFILEYFIVIKMMRLGSNWKLHWRTTSGDVCLQSLRQCEVCTLCSGRAKCIESTRQVFLPLKGVFMNNNSEKYLWIVCSSYAFCVKACCKSVPLVLLGWNFSL